MKLPEKIEKTVVLKNEAALFFLGQAGFILKTSSGKNLVIDAYLSDAAERLFGFKRMIPAPIDASQLNASWYVSTHEHIDHLDLDTIPIVAQDEKTIFIGAPDARSHYNQLGIAEQRFQILEEGKTWQDDELTIRAVYADHGSLAPEALGYLITVDGIRILHTGDTCFRPEELMASLSSAVDIMIAPINAMYGNMNAKEAIELARIVQPRILIGCHFWLFLEHVAENGVGDPATFLKEAEDLPEHIIPMIMAPGEVFIYSH